MIGVRLFALLLLLLLWCTKLCVELLMFFLGLYEICAANLNVYRIP